MVIMTSATASAQIILDFSRTDSGGVLVTGTGSGQTTGAFTQKNWRILDFDTNFISDTLNNFDLIKADSVTGSISNGSSTQQITKFSVNRSLDSNDDMRFSTKQKIGFGNNQSYTFSLTAIFSRATLAFEDLIPGLHVDSSAKHKTEIFGPTTINVSAVPEPASAGLILASAGTFGAILIYRKRKKGKAVTSGQPAD